MTFLTVVCLNILLTVVWYPPFPCMVTILCLYLCAWQKSIMKVPRVFLLDFLWYHYFLTSLNTSILVSRVTIFNINISSVVICYLIWDNSIPYYLLLMVFSRSNSGLYEWIIFIQFLFESTSSMSLYVHCQCFVIL